MCDCVVIAGAVVTALLVRFQGDDLAALARSRGTAAVAVRILAPLLVVVWLVLLQLLDTYDPRFTGSGIAEYAALTRATFLTFSGLAIVSYAFKLEFSRALVFIALPLGWAGLIIVHWLWRMWLGRQRRRGRFQHRVLVVGDQDSVRHLIRTLDGLPAAGYSVVAACCGQALDNDVTHVGSVPVVGHELDAVTAVDHVHADVVACTRSSGFGPLAVRQLAWRLEGSDVEIIVVPDVIDVAGPRIATRPVNGVPLLMIEQPRFGGISLAMKTLMDKVGSLLGLILLSPVFLAVAITIKADDHGPILFRQERIGINGQPFTMLKFRSMRVGSETRHAAMVEDFADANADRGVLFKLERDPRVTRIGRTLRRTSLDELPQLWNVLAGDMSLVGPRPPLPSETVQYDAAALRRLLVKPGMTGMWQISGRSTLSWEESVRLDLYYVENWTVYGDFLILFKTIRAVVGGIGAY